MEPEDRADWLEDALDDFNREQIDLQREGKGNSVQALELELIRIQLELYMKKYSNKGEL